MSCAEKKNECHVNTKHSEMLNHNFVYLARNIFAGQKSAFKPGKHQYIIEVQS